MAGENGAVVRRFVDEIYNQQKLKVADEIFSSDFVLHDPTCPGRRGAPKA